MNFYTPNRYVHEFYGKLRYAILVMKLTVFLLAFTCFQVCASGYAQRITLSEKNVSVETILKKIKKQSGYHLWYEDNLLDKTRNIDINVANVSLEQALESCLKGFPLTYAIVDKTVVIKRDKSWYELLTVSGKVTDEQNIPMPGVSVRLKGSEIGTTTDNQGGYSLNLPDGNGTLVFSSVGFKTYEVKVSNQSILNLKMSAEAQGLNEVVVVGYGTQQKKDILGAISTVGAKDLEERPATNFGYSIEGKAAGVQVLTPSGKPQGGFSIRVRGTTSITADSEPLYVVDGVPSITTYDINPSDIESISILKDAASAAIYGASGANGVVLITTKRGKSQKAQLSFSTYGGISNVKNKIDVLNRADYIALMTEIGQVAAWDNYKDDTDWHKEIYREAYAQNYQLSVNGGNDATTYYLSGSWLKQDGVVRTNTMNRFNFKVNLDQKVNDFIKVGTSVSYARWYDRNIDDNRGSANSGVIMNVLTSSPVTGIYNADGTFTANPLRLSFNNPVAYTDGSINGFNNSRFFGNLYTEVSILKDLKFKTLFGYDSQRGKYNYFLDPFRTDWGRVNKGLADLNMNESEYWLSENTLSYAKTFAEKHVVDAFVGYTASRTTSESSEIETKGFSGISVPTVNGGSIINSATGGRAARTNTSFVGRVRYAYDDKYLLSSNLRADGSSVFGPDKHWGFFPSFSAGWRISKENFLKDAEFISDLKIRYAWGKVGNDHIGPYAWYGLIATGSNYILGEQVNSGTAPQTPENRNLRWESTTQNNIGIDVSLFKSRINLSVDLYRKSTADLLFDKPVPTSSGFLGALQNIGKLENKGIEFALNTKNLTGAVKWESDFNISFNRNKVGYIGDQELAVGGIPQRQQAAIIKEGLPIGTFWGYVSKGVDPKTGNMIYEDVNGNGYNIDEDGALDAGDRKVIGNANPKFTYGFTNRVSYGSFSLDLFLQGVQGNDIFNATRIETEGMMDYRNQSVAVLRRWTKEGQITDIPRAESGNVINSDISSRFIENGSYLRVKSLTLGYKLPQSVLSKMKLRSVSLYVTGENLLTFTKYSGYDPEVSAFAGTGGESSNGALGIDYGTYPQVRQFIFGLSVSF
ncbi:TonB-dependent receptor [Pedobacter foliorum]|uniref:TonB-dependent receptor n=1 Tax=Pedobacter foliorum TaxID=2739058 RepID=UPI001FE8FE17|nr:TonB-dependent receptor [Pedobacter foliorum]